MIKSWMLLVVTVLLCVAPTTGSCQTVTAQYINTIPQADHFTGGDICIKVQAAEVYALDNGINQVDATHFSGTQQCSVNMFGGLNPTGNAAINLTVNFGAVHIVSEVEQHVTNSGLHLHGMGPYATQIEYAGASGVTAALFVDGTTGSGVLGANGLNGFEADGIFFYGDLGNVPDAVVMRQTHRSMLSNIDTWGTTGCGVHSEGAVTDTYYRVHTSAIDATYIGIDSSSHSQPSGGICLDGYSGNQSTDGTVTDNITEGVSGTGWRLISANSMTFTSGTSEKSGQGLVISPGSKYNTFIASDFEGNTAAVTGVDISDNAGYNTFINPIATSPCSGSCSTTAFLSGLGGNDWYIGPAGALYNVSGAGFFGFTPFNVSAGANIPTAASGFVQMWVDGHSVFIPYFNTLP